MPTTLCRNWGRNGGRNTPSASGVSSRIARPDDGQLNHGMEAHMTLHVATGMLLIPLIYGGLAIAYLGHRWRRSTRKRKR